MRFSLLILLLLIECVALAKDDWGKANNLSNGISSIELIANGERFDGWRISVIGVAHFDTEDTLLFPSEESYIIFDTASSILIDIDFNSNLLGLTRQELMNISGEHVLLEGIYQHQPRERLEPNQFVVGPQYVGSIKSINRLAIASREATNRQRIDSE